MKTIIYLTLASLLAVPVLAFAHHEVGMRHDDMKTHHGKKHMKKKYMKHHEAEMDAPMHHDSQVY